jgi:hypothetical protein
MAKRKLSPSAAPLLSAIADPKLVTDWQREIVLYRTLATDETAKWDKRYEVLGRIIDHVPPLYLAGGYSDVRAFLAVEAPDESERSARSRIRVARHFDVDHELEFGISRLDLLLDYLQVTGRLRDPSDKLDPAAQKVRVPNGERVRIVPFPKITAAELRTAIRAAKSKSQAPSAKAPPVVVSLRRLLAEAGLGAVSVSLKTGKLTLGGIDPQAVGKLAKALAASAKQ